ncbi:hypothetical protein A3K79_06795 [Candidatus Bathyarchaeota archaeon RBG_13_46_16b]|nr:MAG: hypothetical protein A3K79_06795 [Candidatus Bathyarchaeota archaeon RBG_13_46_16b]
MAIASKERMITFAVIGLCVIIGVMVFIAVVYQGQANGMQSNFNTEKAYLQSSIDQLQNEKTSLEGQLSSLNAQVASLNNQVSTLNGQVSTLTTENAKLTAQVTDLTVQNEAANAWIKRLQSIIEGPRKQLPVPV